MDPKPLGIYVHVPFCRSKCEYCDFYSLGGGKDRTRMDQYLEAVLQHIRESARLAPGYAVDSVYFGGGTPSFFGAAGLVRILKEIYRRFTVSRDAELTFEANPDSVSLKPLRQLRQVQSLSSGELYAWTENIRMEYYLGLWRPSPALFVLLAGLAVLYLALAGIRKK